MGRQLYETYYNEVNKRGVEIVRCITSPIHTSSIAYHTRMGFVIEKGDKRVEGIEIHSIGSIQPSDNRRFLCMLESAWECLLRSSRYEPLLTVAWVVCPVFLSRAIWRELFPSNV
ncbi:hypothetical protein [Paenibacillus glucanolyticus]|uniref:hypothetical protein n=1 Tax=Paenibacillus TaxID=44249 RepID=UPI0027D218D1|nr:hypothetical protein [Paenibacillus glucanolyticus]